MKEMVMSEKEILTACSKIGASLTSSLKDEDKLPLFVCVMKGAMEFMVDLLKHVDVPLLVDYIQLQSYSGTHSTGEVSLLKDISTNVDGRTVVIVEDVVDTGLSMNFLLDHLKKIGNPKRVIVCALFDKKCARKVQTQVDYVGMSLTENKFLLGYGLDYNGLKRNVPYVYIPTSEEVGEMDEILKKRG
ncbi:MAG: hypoxanthine phosphoribosyltransferase [Bacilli bacterium]|jgi:hypoxanthine phosphoribosyltransferase|nr:hypoxanthine phosphoribosyltransferase [Bacilli bacterium]MCI2055012.1 hypoxanthine phosphoribosyltransferase [Bacilli bacterium]